jgi:ribonuclease BN (tRNA processing enzyme)
MSEIIFLGTGSGKQILHDQSRGLGGIIVKLNDIQIHLDPGPGIVTKAKNYQVDLKKTKIFFLSDKNLDHVNDINLAIDITTGGDFKKGILITEENALSYVTEKYRTLLENIITLEPHKSTEIKGLKFTAIPTKHSCSSIALRLSTEDFILGYTGHTAYTKELEKDLQGVNILIANVLKPFDQKSDDYLTSDDVVKLIDKIKPQLTIMTGFGSYFNNVNPIYEAREIQKKTGQQVVAATDGLKIDPGSYSAKRNQKILSSFTEDED